MNWIEQFGQDVRYALRALRKMPGFAAVVILTVALGIGATTAIFSILYSVLLAPLPYADPARLIALNETTPKVGIVSASYADFLDWRAQSRAFSAMAAVHDVSFNLAGAGQPEVVDGSAVSPAFLTALGVRPYLGRDFEASEEQAGTAPVVLLSYALWQSHFGGDRGAIGRAIELDGRTFTIVGVLPPSFRFPGGMDLLEPIGVWLSGSKDAADRGSRGDTLVVGRLAPGTTSTEARAEMTGIAARLALAYPATNDQFGVELRPLRDLLVGDLGPPLLLLFGAVVFVLLIACANVANLSLVRNAARRTEFALRTAFGAGRGRLVRQALAESLVLSSLGGALGVALAAAGIRGMIEWLPAGALGSAPIALHGPVLAFAVGAIVLAAFVFGLAPALQSADVDVHAELKSGTRAATAARSQARLRAVLAAAEISLSVILLAGAGLMLKSLSNLLAVDPGFRPDHLLTMALDLRTERYDTEAAIWSFWQQLLDGTRALPGVEDAALGTVVPLAGSHSRTDITIEGMPLPQPGSFPHPDYHDVSPGYVRTLGIELVRGRAFTDQDTETAPRVGMINSSLARAYFAGEDPIGRRFMFGHPSSSTAPQWITIVGVVGDTKLYGLANPARMEVYVPFRQSLAPHMTLIVKSRVDAAASVAAVRRLVATLDKDQPVFAVSTMDQLVSNDVATPRITLVLLGLFSGFALVLAAVGVYGVMAWSVAQRTHEIGIRMALGAQGGGVLRMVLAQGGTIAAAGIGVGIAAGFALTRMLSGLLFSVSPGDPTTFAAAALLLGVVALAACYIPARRAVRVDPITALRNE